MQASLQIAFNELPVSNHMNNSNSILTIQAEEYLVILVKYQSTLPKMLFKNFPKMNWSLWRHISGPLIMLYFSKIDIPSLFVPFCFLCHKHIIPFAKKNELESIYIHTHTYTRFVIFQLFILYLFVLWRPDASSRSSRHLQSSQHGC